MRFSRSHIDTFWECPRKYWLRFQDGGTGWERKALNLETSTGALVHEMIAKTLDGIDLDSAIEGAKATYRNECYVRGMDLENSGDLQIEMIRQGCLAEGLARAWCAIRLPVLLREYRVIEVEQEHNVKLCDGIELMFRPDAMLERLSDGCLAPLELKTSGYISDKKMDSFRYDSQTLSQVWAAEQVFGKFVSHVQVELLYKGVKRRDEETRAVTLYSPLVRGYKNTDGSLAFSDSYIDEGGFNRKRTKAQGWRPFQVWDEFEKYKDWFQQLPKEVLEGVCYHREIYRSPREQEIWVRQQVYLQKSLDNNPGSAITALGYEDFLSRVFPARLDVNCVDNKFHRSCPYLGYCYGEIESLEDAGFQPREPHHEQEWEE